MAGQLDRERWMRAARLVLLKRGPHRLSVEGLARTLGVTKGSFYWHFRDRGELLESLLSEWEDESALLAAAIRDGQSLSAIVPEIRRRTLASERGEWPSDAAVFAWATMDPLVARRVNRAEEERMRLFRTLTRQDELADLFYYAYLGFLMRRRRAPDARKDFEQLAALATALCDKPSERRPRPRAAASRT